MLHPADVATPTGLERYRLQGVISQGGFGVVCDAWDEVLQRSVAVKLTRAEAAVTRLMAEAVEQARISHPNVLSVLDAGVDGDAAYVVMERVDGNDAEVASLSPDFTPEKARRWIQDVAFGLHALHVGGLVHGDVSPRNLLVGADGRARLIDFGSSRPDPAGRGVTSGFVAPECGDNPTVRGDVFALGRTLEWLLERAKAPRRDRAWAVFRRACAPAPRMRHASADALARDLEPRPSTGRKRLIVGALVVAGLSGDAVPDLEQARSQRVVEQADALLRECDFAAARPLADTLRAQAVASARDDLLVRSILLDAKIASHEGRTSDAIALRRRAAAHSQGDVDADTRLHGLTAFAFDLPSESADAIVELAEGAATEPEQRSFVDLVRAVLDASDPSRTLPDPAGPHALQLQLAQVLQSLDPRARDEAPPEVPCGSLSGSYAQGLCWSVSAASALKQGELEKAASQASTAITLIDEGTLEDPCDGQLAYFVRGVARIDADPVEAEADLRRVSSLCPEDPPADEAVFDVTRARALVRLGRHDEARALEAAARPYADESEDVAQGLAALAEDRRLLSARGDEPAVLGGARGVR